MGVEQFVYAYLDYPELNVNGEVVTELNKVDKPGWIGVDNEQSNECIVKSQSNRKILIKGPCDVSQIIPFFADSEVFETEFAYVSESKKGMYIESFNHTSQIRLSDELSDEEKRELIDTIPFMDEDYFNSSLFEKNYDYVIFSMLTDYGLGLYQHINNPKYVVAFGQYTVDYTNEENWGNAIKLLMDGTSPSEDMIRQYQYFRENYRYIGRISDDMLVQNLEYIRNKLPVKSKMLFLNGAEKEYIGDCKPNWKNREMLHIEKNKLLEAFVKKYQHNCYIVDVNKYITDSGYYLDTVNHYKKIIYYNLAGDIQEFINKDNYNISLQRKRFSEDKEILFVNYIKKILRKIKQMLS